MKEKIKKLLIVSLAVLMLLTSVPLTGFVGLDIGFTAEAALATSGKCGDNATWKYDAKTKTLTVSGAGKMWDYGLHVPPYMADTDIVIEKVIIENGITGIGNCAFDHENIKSVSLADTVNDIGESAFARTAISSITFPKNLKSIGSNAFGECVKLKKVTLPSSVEEVDSFAFWGCESLASFNSGSGHVKLNSWAIDLCPKLQKTVLGKNTEFVFSNLDYIPNRTAAFSVHKDNPWYTSDENGVLYNKGKTVLLAYPALSKAESFTVPETVTVIHRYAFSESKNIKKVKITSVEEIGDCAFQGSNVKTVELGSKLKKLGGSAFLFCEKISSLTLPASLSEFDRYSFENTISYTVDKNSSTLLSENGNLFNKDKTILYTYYNGDNKTSYKIPDTVVNIEDYAFSNTTKLKSVTLPSKLERIGECAFDSSAVASITIPENVKLIEDSAFSGAKLKKLVFKEGCIAEIGCWAFYDCENLIDITIPASVTKVREGAFDNTGYVNKLEEDGFEGSVYIGNILYSYLGDDTPKSFSIKEGTTTICEDSIPGTSTVKIPASVQFISVDAFLDPYSISKISVDSKNEHFIYEDNTLITKDKTRIIFYLNSLLKTSYKIPDTVTNIDYFAFCTASSLSKIDFGKCKIENINIDTFSTTKWYKSLPLDEYLYINNVAALSSQGYTIVPMVIIKEGTTAIGDYFFYNTDTDAIFIPESVQYIGSVMGTVYYEGTEEQWNSIQKSDSVREYEDTYLEVIFNFDKNNHEHIFYSDNIKYNTCTEEGEDLYICPCGESYTVTTPKIYHYAVYYVYEKPATFKAKGKKSAYCYMCNKKIVTKSTAPIASVEPIKTKYTYSGEYMEPEVIVKDADGNILKDCYYLDYNTDLIKIGTHKITVCFDDYIASGEKTFTIEVLPGKTSKITTTESDSAVKLTWNKVKGATGYRVYLYNTKTKKYEKAGDTTGTSYTVKKLKSGTTYKLAVKAYTKVGKTVYWASSYAEATTATKPSAPVVKTKAGSKKVTLTWDKVTGASGYQVYMMNNDGKFEKLDTTKELKYVKTGLKKGASYSFRVRAYKKIEGKTLYSSYKTYTVKAK